MKEFSFELQSILDLKEQEETALQKELIRLKNRYQEVQKKLESVQQRKQEWITKLKTESKAGLDSVTFRKYKKYIAYLEDQVEELQLQLQHWREKVDSCQQELLEKLKEKKSLSKLKEQRYEEYWEEFLRQEQKLNDEVAINNFNH